MHGMARVGVGDGNVDDGLAVVAEARLEVELRRGGSVLVNG